MSIRFTKYVQIESAIGGNSAAQERDLILRLITTNNLVPIDTTIEFDTADEVGTYFGTTSEEYKRAVFYFGWISKNGTRPSKISFAHWASAAIAPRVYGRKGAQALATWTAITNGSFGITLGGTTHALTGLDFSGAANLAAVAAIIQTALNALSGTMWTAASVAFDATGPAFNLVGGLTGAANVLITAGGSGTDIASQLGWLAGAILAPGSGVQTITNMLIYTTSLSNNFGSFAFLPSLTDSQVLEAATWNDGTDPNILFMYLLPTSAANAQAYYTALSGLEGTAITLSTVASEYPEQVPGMILAATDYTARNSVQNYMFQVFTLTPTVTTDADSDTYDAIRVNYYGQTQTAGRLLQFYQRGNLMGLATTDPVDQNVYANEMWLKDAAGASIMSLLIALAKISANAAGRIQILGVLQGVINQGLLNGTISVFKTLDDIQKLYITEQTGDSKAWYQVQNSGYWLDVRFVKRDDQYVAIYTLIYSKDDVVRKVEGRHILI